MKFRSWTFPLLLLLVPVLDAAEPARIQFQPGRTSAQVTGHFTTKVTERFFVARASKGQHMKVEIRPLTTDLITAGTVTSPSGKMDGAPGGLIFDSDLNESGDYKIRVFERQQQLPGKFALRVTIK